MRVCRFEYDIDQEIAESMVRSESESHDINIYGCFVNSLNKGMTLERQAMVAEQQQMRRIASKTCTREKLTK